jgi:hypothetical protein
MSGEVPTYIIVELILKIVEVSGASKNSQFRKNMIAKGCSIAGI